MDAWRRLEGRSLQGGPDVARALWEWQNLETWNDSARPEVFQKVVAAGPAAIRPLLDCLENDRRWTRIRTQDDDDSFIDSEVLRVRELAIMALERVLDGVRTVLHCRELR